MHRTGGRCKLPRYRSRSRPTQAREPKPPFFRVPPFPNCAKSIQARPRLSFTATYRSQQMEQGASDGPLYKQLRGQADQRKKPPRRKKKKEAAWIERGKRTTHAHQKVLREQPTRRPTAPYSNCTKEEVLQGFRRRAAWTGMSQLTAAIRHAFPSSCATRNAAPHFPFGPRKAHRRGAGQVETSLLAHRRRYSAQKTATMRGAQGNRKGAREQSGEEKRR